MTTNEQRDTAAILQMKADLDEARELLAKALYFVNLSDGAGLVKHDIYRFLARTEPKHETANR